MSKKFTFQGKLESVEKNITFQTNRGDTIVKSLITFDDSEEYKGKTLTNKLTFELYGSERAKVAETLRIGLKYEVKFSISSRSYNGKIFTTLSAYTVTALGGVNQSAAASKSDDNLPF